MNKSDIKCRVCGDRASGFNWNAYTCASCRYFFQRNVAKQSTLVCRNSQKDVAKNNNSSSTFSLHPPQATTSNTTSNSDALYPQAHHIISIPLNDFKPGHQSQTPSATSPCHIDLQTRRRCARCRLDKCFLVGMRPMAVVGVGGGKSPAGGVLESSDSSSNDSNSGAAASESLFSNNKPRTNIPSLGGENSSRQALDHYIQNGVLHSAPLEGFNEDGNYDFLSESFPTPDRQSSAVQEMRTWFVMTKPRQYATDLTAVERQVIEALCGAVGGNFAEETRLPILAEEWDLVRYLQYPVSYSRPVVRLSKALDPFRCLGSEDQFRLLSSFYMDVLTIRAVYCFDGERRGFPAFFDESQQGSVMLRFGNHPTPEEPYQKPDLHQYAKLMHDELEGDHVLRNLLIGQFIFRHCEVVSEPANVRYQYFLYSRLLWRYLEAKYRHLGRARRKFFRLQNLFTNHLALKREIRRLTAMMLTHHLPDWLTDLYLATPPSVAADGTTSTLVTM